MELNKLSIDTLNLKGQRIFMRCDFNVDQDKKTGKIINNARIIAAIPSIKYCLDNGAKSVVIGSHLGRFTISHLGVPTEKQIAQFTLAPVAAELRMLLGVEVTFLPDCVGEEVEAACANPPQGSIILLENLRFCVEERQIDEIDKASICKFKESLSKLGDVYVNDTFGITHKGHSSMLGDGYQIRAAGFLLKKELRYFSKALFNPPKPFLIILGGNKLKNKIQLIDNLLDRVDEMMIMGSMAFTFLKVMYNMDIGSSLYDEEGAKDVPNLIEKAKKNKVDIFLPTDFIAGDNFGEDAAVIKVLTVQTGIPDGFMVFDIGEQSRKTAQEIISRSKILFWNSSAGVLLFENFSKGTKALIDAVVAATAKGTISIIGGGTSENCCFKWDTNDKVSHVSAGCHACLDLLQGKVLPGVATLSNVDAKNEHKPYTPVNMSNVYNMLHAKYAKEYPKNTEKGDNSAAENKEIIEKTIVNLLITMDMDWLSQEPSTKMEEGSKFYKLFKTF